MSGHYCACGAQHTRCDAGKGAIAGIFFYNVNNIYFIESVIKLIYNFYLEIIKINLQFTYNNRISMCG